MLTAQLLSSPAQASPARSITPSSRHRLRMVGEQPSPQHLPEVLPFPIKCLQAERAPQGDEGWADNGGDPGNSTSIYVGRKHGEGPRRDGANQRAGRLWKIRQPWQGDTRGARTAARDYPGEMSAGLGHGESSEALCLGCSPQGTAP